jgi:hypothetical protein
MGQIEERLVHKRLLQFLCGNLHGKETRGQGWTLYRGIINRAMVQPVSRIIQAATDRTLLRDRWIELMCSLAGVNGARNQLNKDATIGNVEGVIESRDTNQVSARVPLMAPNQFVEAGLSPRGGKGISKGELARAGDLNLLATNAPAVRSEEFNAEKGEGLTNPIQEHVLPVGGEAEDPDERSELRPG